MLISLSHLVYFKLKHLALSGETSCIKETPMVKEPSLSGNSTVLLVSTQESQLMLVETMVLTKPKTWNLTDGTTSPIRRKELSLTSSTMVKRLLLMTLVVYNGMTDLSLLVEIPGTTVSQVLDSITSKSITEPFLRLKLKEPLLV